MESDGPFGSSPGVGVGFSDAALLVVSLLGFIILSITVYAIIITRVKSREEFEHAEEQKLDFDERLDRADVATLNRAQRRARAKNIMKRQRRIAPADDATTDAAEQPNQEQEQQINTDSVQHLSRKERQKAAKATERQERRLYEDKRREQQREAQEQAQKLKQEKARLEAEQLEEERRMRAIEKEARQELEYEEWRILLSKDDGDVMTVMEFREMAQNQRTVAIDELAERFRIPFDQVQKRLVEVVGTRRLTGVVDLHDGRFIHFSSDELVQISKQIRRKQSVSFKDVSDIVESIICK